MRDTLLVSRSASGSLDMPAEQPDTLLDWLNHPRSYDGLASQPGALLH